MPQAVRPIANLYPTLYGCEPGAGGSVVVIGFPYDRGTTPEHAGCAEAPHTIRRLSEPEATRVKHGAIYDLATRGVVFQGHALSDLGNLRYRPEQSDDSYLKLFTQSIFLLAREGKRPLTLGGDHLATLLALRGIARAGRRVQVVHLDAHHDYDTVGVGERPTHATFMSFVASERLAEKVVQIGVRGLVPELPAPPDGVLCLPLSQLKGALLPSVDVYLTVDTDAFDPAVAPAVQFPLPMGLELGALLEVLNTCRDLGLHGAGADWTEYSPSLDPANLLTGRLVLHGLAHIIRYLSTEYP